MTSFSSPIATLNPQTQTYVRTLRRRIARLGLAASTLWGIAAALAVLVLGAWIDLAFELSGSVRAGIDITTLLTIFIVGAGLLIRGRRAVSMRGVAERLDHLANARGQIVTGLDLAMSPTPAALPLTRGLAQIAAERAADLMRNVRPTAAAPARQMRTPTAVLSLILALVMVLAMAAPRLVGTQWLRFFDPFGDHPPYSALQFSVTPGDASVVYGSPLDVRVTTSGAAAEDVDLIYLAGGQPAQIVPMFPEGTGSWRATLANLVSPGQYFLRSGSARTQRYDISVLTVPRIQNVAFVVTLPPYTHRAPYLGPLPQGGLAGLRGTTVQIRAQSNRPLSGGTLSLTTSNGTRQIQMNGNGNEAVGNFTIQSAGKFQFTLADTTGQASADSFSGTVSLLEDQKPFVRIVEPPLMSFATPDATIKVTAIGEDDYGISRLQIYRGVDDSQFTAQDVPVPPEQPTRLNGGTALRLSDIGVSPGEVIKIFARVEDNDPAGAKGSESTVAAVHIVSQEELDRMAMARNAMEVLQSKYAQAERRLEAADADAQRIEKELAGQDPSKSLAPAQKREIDELTQRLSKDSKDIAELANHHLPVDIDAALTAQLQQVAGKFAEAAADAGQAGKPGLPGGGALDEIKKIRALLGKEKQDYNAKAMLPLAYLARILPLIANEREFIDLAKHQQDLSDRLSSLEGRDGGDDPQMKARMRDLEDEQHELRDNLQTLLENIASEAAALPADPKLDELRQSASAFARAVRASPADGQMQSAQSSLDDFAGTQASASAHDAAKTLDSFIHRCNAMGSCASDSLFFQPTLSSALGDSISQLLKMGGMGSGDGGYSAYANSLENIGLYGTIPLMSRESGNGGEAESGVASRDDEAANGNPNPDALPPHGQQRAQGIGQAPVPSQYQKRVGDYFQRVEDELSN